MRRNRWSKKAIPKKSDAEKMQTSMNHFKVPDGTLAEGRHVLGYDPGKRNLGWAVFKISGGKAVYVDSGTLKVKGKPNTENEAFVHINEFLSGLAEKYNPTTLCWERAIGRGNMVAREALGEVQGLIKLSGFKNDLGTVMKPVTTTCMETVLLGSAGRNRPDKKIVTSTKVKSMFPKQLEDRKVTKTGIFTHEADAIACLYVLFKANSINIEGVQYEEGHASENN